MLVYAIGSQALEVVSMSSGQPSGIGTNLLAAAVDTARSAGCTRVWLVTTNDNGPALRFYRRRGFVLTAVHRDAVAADRALKPEIPALGRGGIAIRDYLELEYRLP